MCLKKYDIYNITKTETEELRLRNKKWGFGKVYVDIQADILLCDHHWKYNRHIIYPIENIYYIPLKQILPYIKKYRSKKKFLTSWWIDESLQRPLTGVEKWDMLTASMKKYGWDNLQPACIKITQKKQPIVVNGHHRISIADYLNISKIPVNFIYK